MEEDKGSRGEHEVWRSAGGLENKHEVLWRTEGLEMNNRYNKIVLKLGGNIALSVHTSETLRIGPRR